MPPLRRRVLRGGGASSIPLHERGTSAGTAEQGKISQSPACGGHAAVRAGLEDAVSNGSRGGVDGERSVAGAAREDDGVGASGFGVGGYGGGASGAAGGDDDYEAILGPMLGGESKEKPVGG